MNENNKNMKREYLKRELLLPLQLNPCTLKPESLFRSFISINSLLMFLKDE